MSGFSEKLKSSELAVYMIGRTAYHRACSLNFMRLGPLLLFCIL